MPKLVSREDPRKVEFPILSRRVLLGSDPGNDVVIQNSRVEARHAIITRGMRHYQITDVGTQSGTFVNRRRIPGPTLLFNDDEITIGGVRLVCVGFPPPKKRLLRIPIDYIAMILAGLMLLILFFFRGPQMLDWIATQLAALADQSNAGGPAWLHEVNRYRAASGLPPVAAVSSLSAAELDHTQFVAANFSEAILRGESLGFALNDENATAKDYSLDGARAAIRSEVVGYRGINASRGGHQWNWPFANWMAAPFARLSILDPRLRGAGFSEYCANGACAAALDTSSDVHGPPLAGNWTAPPIAYPPDGGVVTTLGIGRESLNALSACPGYSGRVGLPITLQLGNWIAPRLDGYSLTRRDSEGRAVRVEACGIDSGTYFNDTPAEQWLGRLTLKVHGAVMVIPRHPLEAPAHYDAALNVNGHEYRWSFDTERGNSDERAAPRRRDRT